MKRMLTLCLIAFVGVAAADAAAQDLLPSPFPGLQYYAAQPTPALPPSSRTLPPAYPLGASLPPVELYTDVKIEDPRNIHPCAVPIIVEVPDPCDECGTVCIEICAPPCEPECVKRHGLRDRKVTFDYGDYGITVTSRRGVVKVDYDD
jgi:hypothetical protein